MGDPSHSLQQALRRFNYALERFGITGKKLGVTAHGLRHKVLIHLFESLTGKTAPVRGDEKLPPAIGNPARQEVTELAGHARRKASNAYCGKPAQLCRQFDPASPKD